MWIMGGTSECMSPNLFSINSRCVVRDQYEFVFLLCLWLYVCSGKDGPIIVLSFSPGLTGRSGFL